MNSAKKEQMMEASVEDLVQEFDLEPDEAHVVHHLLHSSDHMSDQSTPEKTMDVLKKIVVDGLSVDMTDMAANVVQRAMDTKDASIKTLTADIDTIKKSLSDAEVKLSTTVAANATVLATKDAEIETLKKQLADSAMTPQKLDGYVKDRMASVLKARTILGDKLVIDGKSDHEIRKQVVDSVLGDTAKDWNEAQISASFNTLTAKAATNDGRTNDVLATALSNVPVVTDTRDAAYQEYDKNLSNAWKTKAA